MEVGEQVWYRARLTLLRCRNRTNFCFHFQPLRLPSGASYPHTPVIVLASYAVLFPSLTVGEQCPIFRRNQTSTTPHGIPRTRGIHLMLQPRRSQVTLLHQSGSRRETVMHIRHLDLPLEREDHRPLTHTAPRVRLLIHTTMTVVATIGIGNATMSDAAPTIGPQGLEMSGIESGIGIENETGIGSVEGRKTHDEALRLSGRRGLGRRPGK